MKISKSKKFWINHIQKFEQSNLSQSEYCKMKGINKSSFSAQKTELKRQGLISSDSASPFMSLQDASHSTRFSITLSSGHIITFDQLPDIKWITEFLGEVDASQS
jgi:hypothetical protein